MRTIILALTVCSGIASATQIPQLLQFSEIGLDYAIVEIVPREDAYCHIVQQGDRINPYTYNWQNLTDCATATTLTITDLLPGEYYHWRVIAYDVNGIASPGGPVSHWQTHYPPDPESSVVNRTAVADQAFLFGYSVPCNPKCVYEALDPVPQGFAIGGANGYVTWTPDTAGLTCISIRASNEYGENQSSLCIDVQSSGTDLTPPGLSYVTGFTDITSSGFSVYWTPANDDFGIDYYWIYCQRSAHGAPLLVCGQTPGDGLMFTVTDLAADTSYKIWIQAVDIGGNVANISGQSPTSVRTLPETPPPSALPETPPQRFSDVPPEHWAFTFIDALAESGITAGCGNDNYCPEDPVTRAQMAVFLELGIKGSDFGPPAATGNVFLDVAASDFAASFIEQLYADGITAGCGANNYCPGNSVTRAEMAVFLLRAVHGAGYIPPASAGMFDDVDLSHWAVSWIEQLAAEGITSGCGNGNYCPEDSVTRAQMAVFLVRAFGL